MSRVSRRTGLSPERFTEVRTELRATRNRLVTLFTEIANIYPLDKGNACKAARFLEKAWENIDESLWALEVTRK